MDNPPDGAKNNTAEQVVKKPKTIQHLLSDWRTAYAMSKKVILLDLSSYLFLSICFQETTAGNKNTTSLSQPPTSRGQCNKESLKINSGCHSLKVIFSTSQIIIIINKYIKFFRGLFIPEKMSGKRKQYSIQQLRKSDSFLNRYKLLYLYFFHLSFILFLDTWSTNVF